MSETNVITNPVDAVVMCNFRKEKHNPIELIKKWCPDANIDHIIYDQNMKNRDRDYWRIEQSGGDCNTLFYH